MKKKLKLKGTKTQLFSNQTANLYFDDLEKINSIIGNDSIRNIRIKKINIYHGWVVDSIQLFYKVLTNDNKNYFIEGNRYGGATGSLTTIDLKSDEYVSSIWGETCDYYGGFCITQLGIKISSLSQQENSRTCGLYGSGNCAHNKRTFQLNNSCAAIFGRSAGNTGYLNALGVWEGEISNDDQCNIVEHQNLTKDLDNTRSQLNSKTNQLTGLQSKLITKDLEITDLKSQTKSTNQLLAQKDSNLADLQSQIKELNIKLGNNEVEKSNLQFEINRKEAEFAQAEAKINKLEESRQNLQAEIKNLEESLRKLRENTEENKRSIRKLEREKNGLEEDLAETEKDLTIAQQEKQQLAKELSTLQKELSPTNLPTLILNKEDKSQLENFFTDYLAVMRKQVEDYKKVLASREIVNPAEERAYQTQKQELEAKIEQTQPYLTKLSNWK
jgi:predicted  nucleic acid-binding Zn-ribbon protein